MDRYGFSRTYLDFDELCADARAWDLELVPTDHGVSEGRIALGGLGPVQLARARFGRGLLQRGAPPGGHWTFGVPLASSTPFRWRGHEVCGDHVLVFPLDGELHSGSQPGFHIFTIAVEAHHLARLAHEHGLSDPSTLVGTTEVFPCPPPALHSLRRLLAALCSALCEGGRVREANLEARLVQDLPLALLDVVTLCNQRVPAPPLTRLAVARRLDAYLATEAVLRTSSVRNLTGALGVSERTLRRACHEAYGCGPKELLQGRRLTEVRRMLRRSDPARTRIWDIAGRFGFWHMGQFASDYRRRFGELPSETLRHT